MHEAQPPRVQHDARRFDSGPHVIADVHALAQQRVPRFGEVDADLVLAPGLQAALYEGGALQLLDGRHVRHREPRGRGRRARRVAVMAMGAAQPVAAIEQLLGVGTRQEEFAG